MPKAEGEVGVRLSNGWEVRVATQREAKKVEEEKEEQVRETQVFGNIRYGGEVWTSAEVLTKFLSADPGRAAGKRVCELGCGCALAGLTAGALGAREVTLTDWTPFMAEYNLKKNFGGHPELFERFRFRKLDWGDMEMIAATDPPFDLIIGSDIMYGSWNSIEKLAETIAALLSGGPGGTGTALMVTPNWVQENKKDREKSFEAPLRRHGLEIRDLSEESPAKEIIAAAPEDRGPIRVLEIIRGGGAALAKL